MAYSINKSYLCNKFMYICCFIKLLSLRLTSYFHQHIAYIEKLKVSIFYYSTKYV